MKSEHVLGSALPGALVLVKTKRYLIKEADIFSIVHGLYISKKDKSSFMILHHCITRWVLLQGILLLMMGLQ